MQRLIKDARRKVLLILDKLNVRKAKAARDWSAQYTAQIEVFYLPPYAPELNPTEYFNGELKGQIQRGVAPKDVKDLKRTMLSRSRRIHKSPARVRAPLQEPLHPTGRVSSLQLRRVNSD
jgi:transposase